MKFTGQIEYDRVSLYIGAADFCLAPFDPARGEVSPLKVIDYLFCGRPTVIARIAPVEELLRQFPSLLPFVAGDARALADSMCHLLAHQPEFLDLAGKDSVAARDKYSWEKIALQIERECFSGARP